MVPLQDNVDSVAEESKAVIKKLSLLPINCFLNIRVYSHRLLLLSTLIMERKFLFGVGYDYSSNSKLESLRMNDYAVVGWPGI